MARFCTTWLLLLSGLFIVIEVAAAFINQPGAEPKFSFLQEPPEQAIVSKKFPAVLHCTVKLSESIRDDFRYSFEGHRTALNGGDHNDDDEEEEDDIEGEGDDVEEELGGLVHPNLGDHLENDHSKGIAIAKDQDYEEYDQKATKEEEEEAAGNYETTTGGGAGEGGIKRNFPSLFGGAASRGELLNKRKQLTHFNALKSDDDLAPGIMGAGGPLRFSGSQPGGVAPEGMELFQDRRVTVPSRRPAKQQVRHQKRRRRRRRHLNSMPPFEYLWSRNGEPLDLEGSDGYELTKDGTLKISYSEDVAGTYRCVINGSRWNFGALISRESNVTVAEFMRSNVATNVTAQIGNPLVLNCPFYSWPPANITWFFNDTPIDYGTSNRYYQMANGSLLITKMTGFDDGKFRCVAVNNLVPKSKRVFKPQVNVVPQQNIEAIQRLAGRLMGPFQDSLIRLKEGSSLHLLCAAYHPPAINAMSAEVRWSFTPRTAQIPIELPAGNALKFSQVIRDQHDGIYNCSTGTDYQTFDVSVFVAPLVTKELNSITTTMVASITLDCEAVGFPQPEIEWFKNGHRITSKSVLVIENGNLKIHSVDPEDQGIYQCFAKNDVGQAYSTAYLTVRTSDVQLKVPRLYGIRCYPESYGSLLVTFRTSEPVDMVTYYLATDDPRSSWDVVPPIEAHHSFVIRERMDPLREYTLYLRGLQKMPADPNNLNLGSQLSLSRMSKGIRCHTQGMQVLSTGFPDHIFIWWPTANRRSNYSAIVDHYLVQLWNNETLGTPNVFSSEVIGTTENVDEFKTWEEIEKLLVKIPAQTSWINSSYAMGSPADGTYLRRKSLKPTVKVHYNVTEIRVAGTVTGLLIPNTKRVMARVIGVKSGETIVDQELRYVQWKSVENSENGVSKLRIVNTNSKNVQLAWNAFGREKSACLELCYRNTNAEFVLRGVETECKIINANKSSVILKPLPPMTTYKMYLKTCNSSEPITNIIDVLTKPDVPGKVKDPGLKVDEEDNGVTFSWEPPLMQPGLFIQYYIVVWEKAGEPARTANLTIDKTSLKIPGITGEDRFNISIRAVGNTGVGIPHYFNFTKPMSFYGDSKRLLNPKQVHHDHSQYTDTILAIAIGSVLCVVFIFICGTIIYCHRRRAKARRRQQQLERHHHEQQQLRGNQQMMNSVDYSGMNNGTDSYRFNMGNGGVSSLDNSTTILPANDPLTFHQPSVVRDEILSGTVPTIIHRQPLLASDQHLDMHEMQTLIGGGNSGELGNGGAVLVVPNMTMTTAMSEETMSMPSDSNSGRGSSLSNNGTVNSVESVNGEVRIVGMTVPMMTSTPTKVAVNNRQEDGRQKSESLRLREDEEEDQDFEGSGRPLLRENGFHRPEPTVEWSSRQPAKPPSPHSPISYTNNNNPMLVDKNAPRKANGSIPKVQFKMGRSTMAPTSLPTVPGAVYSTVKKASGVLSPGNGSCRRAERDAEQLRPSGEASIESGEKDNLIQRDGRLVQENGYGDEDDSRVGLLMNGSGVSAVSVENGSTAGGHGVGPKTSLATNPLWETFRRPIVGPNG